MALGTWNPTQPREQGFRKCLKEKWEKYKQQGLHQGYTQEETEVLRMSDLLLILLKTTASKQKTQ